MVIPLMQFLLRLQKAMYTHFPPLPLWASPWYLRNIQFILLIYKCILMNVYWYVARLACGVLT